MISEFLFLGTGGSAGVPLIGCACAVCTSNDFHNKRLRSSGLVRIANKQLLIDSGPDFREQALKYCIHHLDGVLLTHSHFDHIAGLDELRAYYLLHRKVLPILVSEATMHDLKQRFDYLFQAKSWQTSLAAQLDFHVLKNERGRTEFIGIPLNYVTYWQGGMKVNGYRFGSFAYISDIRHYPKTIFEDLKGVEILVLSAVRYEPSAMHFNLEEAVEFAKKVEAKKVYLTHIGHRLDHVKVNASLPEGVSLAYDGLKEKFPYEF